jgi:hypothetical protein
MSGTKRKRNGRYRIYSTVYPENDLTCETWTARSAESLVETLRREGYREPAEAPHEYIYYQ